MGFGKLAYSLMGLRPRQLATGKAAFSIYRHLVVMGENYPGLFWEVVYL